MGREYARGGFRYLSLKNNGTGDIELKGVSVYFTAAPTQNLQNYTGYFHSDDELINRIWYAGAYTNRKYHPGSNIIKISRPAFQSLRSHILLKGWVHRS